MALYDQNLTFFKANPGQAVTGTAVSELTYDLLQGLALDTVTGTYIVPPNAIIGRIRPETTPPTRFWGQDLGTGRGMGDPTVDVYADPATTPAGLTSIQVQLLGAVDNGGGTIAGLTFVPYITSDVLTLAEITQNFAEGLYMIAEFDLPRRPIGAPLPRFLQIGFTVVGAATGLNLKSYIGLGDTSAQDTLGQYPANY